MSDSTAVQLTISLTLRQASRLWWQGTSNFLHNALEHFEFDDDVDPLDPKFTDGTMFWCATAADMLLLQAYELACGFESMYLWDLNNYTSGLGQHVLLSARPFASRIPRPA